MKTTDVSWRAVIGSFRTCKFKSKCVVLIKISVILSVTMITILLLIGGLEMNPGPQDKVDFKDVTYNMVLRLKDTYKGINRWTMMASALTGQNGQQLCNFLRQLEDTALVDKKGKYFETSVNDLFIFIRFIDNTIDAPTNTKSSISIWGKLAELMFETNNRIDRSFLNSLWEIGNQVEDLGRLQNVTRLATNQDILRRQRFRHQQSCQSGIPNTAPNQSQILQLSPNYNSTHDTPSTDVNDRIIQKIKDKFRKKVFNYLTEVCFLCDGMLYKQKEKCKIRQVTDNIIQLLQTVDPSFSNDTTQWTLCTRCDSNLSKGKVPAKAKVNKMALAPVPPEIKCLSAAEIRLISQVRAYVKVFLLSSGRGQKACRGMVIHFPTEVAEVVKQLPLSTVESDFIVVREKGCSDFIHPAFKIDPAKVHAALCWLVRYNPLYKDVVIRGDADPKQMQSVVLSKSQSSHPNIYMDDAGVRGYQDIGNETSILHASFSQSNQQLFGSNAGQQCTAMAASFLAHCFIQPPDSWTRQTIDGVLITGNDHYVNRREALGQHLAYLAVDEVVSPITVFDRADVLLTLDNSPEAIQFIGYANKCRLHDLPRMSEVIQRFIAMGYLNGIITFNVFSMGLHVHDGNAYYFDSHSRGVKGGKTRNREGTACVIKFPIHSAHNKISTKANLNCIPTELSQSDIEHMRFTITVVNANREHPDELPEIMSQVHQFPPLTSPPNKIPRLERMYDYDSDSDSNNDDNQLHLDRPIHNPLPISAGIIDGDCVIDRDDPIAPAIDEVLQEYELDRQRLPPIHSQYEQQLDLLAFPHLYPNGRHGLHADRVIPITPLDYFQQRFMCPDQRFAGASDALFAALADCDKYRIKQKIAICCEQKRQGSAATTRQKRPDTDLESLTHAELLGIRDPHVYMSCIRGSSSYWRQYTGDLIAMVKTLGQPTFFLTFSYDDLNSEDSINALYKAKHGPHSDNVNPTTLPFEERKELLNDYPIVAARHFSMRLSKFLALIKRHGEEIFGRKLQDYSVRVEFQQRGSPHAHMLLWLEHVPEWSTPEGISFIERNVSCSLSSKHQAIVLRYQKHNHTKTCFKNRNSNCRFGFEKPVSEQTKILNDHEIIQNKGRFFLLKRTKEETMIGYYHPILLPVLLCNMDIQIVTSAVGVAYYIAKYMSKAEPLEIRQDIRDCISSIQGSTLPARQKMFKVAMTLMRNREVSAQEAAFRLCHLYLRMSSRRTIFLPTFLKQNRVRMVKRESLAQNGEVQFCTNIIERYQARPRTPEFDPICLAEFAANYELVERARYTEDFINDEDLQEFPILEDEALPDHARPQFRCMDSNGRELGRIRKRTKPAVIKHPNFHPITDSESYYYSLILMYWPFREENFCNNEMSAIQFFQARHGEFRTHIHDTCLRPDLAEEIDRALLLINDFSEEERLEANIDNPFNPPFENIDQDAPPPTVYEVFPAPKHATSTSAINLLRNMVTGLNSEQRAIFNTFHNYIRNNTSGQNQILLAPGGTGKSHLISVLSLLIRQCLGHDALLLGAPTGKASFAIRGLTLHKLFQLPIQKGFIKNYQKLNDKRLSEFRQRYKNVKFVIIDEISMVSYETFRMIHMRMCEIFGNDEPFGGKNVLVVGDLMQLPPVKASRIYKKPEAFSAERDLWRDFTFSELTINMRQGNDPLAKICSELRVGQLTNDSLKLLRSRMLDNLGHRAEEWNDAVHIFPRNKQCKTHNNRKLSELQRSGICVSTIHAHDTYSDGPKQGIQVDRKHIPKNDEDTGGIPTTLKLAVGAHVMLRTNLDTERGLCNGSTGVITGIRWPVNSAVQIGEHQLPREVIIRFDHDNIERSVEPITIDFQGKFQQRVTRRMLPLILSWACTIHKMQGATLTKAVVDLSAKCDKKGMAYVALSRVSSLDGLAIKTLDVSKLLADVPVDTDALIEIDRLRATLNNITTQLHNMCMDNMEIDENNDEPHDDDACSIM